MADAVVPAAGSEGPAAGAAAGAAQPEKPGLAQLLMKLGVLYVSFMFFSKQFQTRQIKEAVAIMQESEQDDVSQILKPVPKGEENVSWMKEAMGIQSSRIPQFPEYDARGRQLKVHRCTFNKGQRVDLYVYMTESKDESSVWGPEGQGQGGGDSNTVTAPARLLWQETDLIFSGEAKDMTRSTSLTLDLPPALLNNGSTWAHVFFTKQGLSPDPNNPRYKDGGVSHQVAQLNRYLPKPKNKDGKYLVDSKKSAADAIEEKERKEKEEKEAAVASPGADREMVNFWKPTLSFGQVDFTAIFQRNHIPSTFAGHITFQASTGNYHPILYVNEFWLQQKHLVALNSTVETVDLTLDISPIGLWKFQTMSQLESQWEAQAKLGMAGDGDQDTFRELLAETNPIVLLITMIVSVLHSVFNFLAFKNDISFWKDKKRSLEGISVRSMLVNLFFQSVIFLYLADNDTTYMILVTNAIGLAIEVWKVGRFMVGRLDWGGEDGQPRRRIPKVTVQAKETYRKSKTKEFDDIATAHLLYLVAPLMVGYAAYSLLNQQHKGWYSWVLSSLVGFVYMFGFVMMTPQLFINYKASGAREKRAHEEKRLGKRDCVAHMPWRVMSYKFINTFIDDLFAFIVPMPVMHRLACFRDDIVFFVFLYQRYLYPVDRARRNEYGQSATMSEDAKKIRDAQLSNEPRVARVPRRSKTDKTS
ncbi:unnamed protein product [Scytosiphon promiscuus]